MTSAARRAPGLGLVLGKFLPPHLGHVYLVEFARAYVEQVSVVVGTLAQEPIPGALRHAWMRELFPDLDVVHLTDENPQEPSEHPDFWRIWRDSLLAVLPRAPDLVFASEDYGAPLAAVLGARFVPVDRGRAAVPVSGSAIRRDPLSAWRFLPRCVRPYYALRVCVFGPESTGKSTLARRLAERYETVWVPEYARTLLEAQGGRLAPSDMEQIARGQAAAEDALLRETNRLLLCDTDPLTTTLWAEALHGDCPDAVRAVADGRRYDLTLLCDVDVPFVPDPVRYLPDERASFFRRCEAALVAEGRRYVVVRGGWEERFAIACAAVDELLVAPPRP